MKKMIGKRRRRNDENVQRGKKRETCREENIITKKLNNPRKEGEEKVEDIGGGRRK